MHLIRRERGPARKLAEEAIALAEEQSFPTHLAIGKLVRLWALTGTPSAEEEIEGLLAELQGALAAFGETGTLAGAPLILAATGDTYRELGRDQEALCFVEAGLAISERTGQPFCDAELNRIKAELLLRPDGGAESDAEGLLRKAVEIAQHQEAKTLELRAATSLAHLWQRQGKRAGRASAM